MNIQANPVEPSPKPSPHEPPPPRDKKRYDFFVIGFTVIFVILMLIVLNNSDWRFSWQPNGVANLVAVAGGIFIIALAVERYIKIFLVDSNEDEIVNLKYQLKHNDKKYTALYADYLNHPDKAANLVPDVWKLEKEMNAQTMRLEKLQITRKERLRLISFVMGCAISILGFPLIGYLIVIEGELHLEIAQKILKCLDVILFGALISGGSSAVSSFFDAIKDRIKP